MTVAIDKLEQIINEYTTKAAQKLAQFAESNNSKAVVKPSSWSNTNGIATSFVTCYTDGDVASDAIEGVISVSLSGSSMHFSADICYSDGRVVSNISDQNIDVRDGTYIQIVRNLSSVAQNSIVDYIQKYI